jgi:hypothetical protein
MRGGHAGRIAQMHLPRRAAGIGGQQGLEHGARGLSLRQQREPFGSEHRVDQ